MSSMLLRVGTDCSGTDAPLYALAQTRVAKKKKVQIIHQWSCDKCPASRRFIELNHNPAQFYPDMIGRKHKCLEPIDLYFNGFPCQPFSSLGLKKGMQDIRMGVYKAMIKTIKAKMPKAIVLENVVRMLGDNNGKTWKKIRSDLCKCGYNINWRIYDAQHFGVPQVRRRIYVVGFRADMGWPELPDEPKKECPYISDFLDDDMGSTEDKPAPWTSSGQSLKRLQSELKAAGVDPNKQCWVLDIDASKSFGSMQCELSPTLTRTRASGFWLTSKRRRMTASEQFKLQGFPIASIVPVESRRQMGQLAGNAMCVPVVTHLLNKVLPQMGF